MRALAQLGPRRNCASGAASAWLSASGLAYCPPVALRSSSTTTSAPASAAAIAADNPAGPAPTTSTSHARSSACAPVGFGAERRRAAGSPRRYTTMPSATLVMQARWPMRPSTVTTQSKQAPMPQCSPRGAPLAVRRNATMPAADSAAAIGLALQRGDWSGVEPEGDGAAAGRMVGWDRRIGWVLVGGGSGGKPVSTTSHPPRAARRGVVAPGARCRQFRRTACSIAERQPRRCLAFPAPTDGTPLAYTHSPAPPGDVVMCEHGTIDLSQLRADALRPAQLPARHRGQHADARALGCGRRACRRGAYQIDARLRLLQPELLPGERAADRQGRWRDARLRHHAVLRRAGDVPRRRPGGCRADPLHQLRRAVRRRRAGEDHRRRRHPGLRPGGAAGPRQRRRN